MEENRGLKAAIIKAHGSQSNFAEELSVSESLISQVVRGRRRLGPESRKKWAELLKVQEEELFPEEDSRA